ncbi:hypothetical protein IID23_04150 [Patescibacteria group bacterium]|nr:hypothetical protein [Patescibacteria group bacterium]
MKYDYFIASRYRNKNIVLDLVNRIRKKNKSVYCFIESKASRKHVGELHEDAEKSISGFEAIPNWRDDSKVKEVFVSDMTSLKNSSNIILLLPSGKSSHIEAGVAYGLSKHLILIGEQKETESLYLIFNEIYSSVDEFIKNIRT